MNPEIKEAAESAFSSGKYKKNIFYHFSEDANLKEFALVKVLGGSPGQSAWAIQQAYRKVGAQMQVSKEVSRDLEATDFGEASKINNLNWVAPVVELYFEDPRLPTMLVGKYSPKDMEGWFPGLEIGLKSEEYITALIQEGSDLDSMFCSLQLKPEMYEDFLETAQCPDMQGGLFSHSLSPSDNATMCYMLHLAFKVFAFASIPQYKPSNLSKKEMHFGGKPGVKGRPNRMAYKIAYLPQVLSERKFTIPSGQKHEFHGRRGFLRHYYHERFTIKRGTWDFIKPVPDPISGKYPITKVFKVRKVI